MAETDTMHRARRQAQETVAARRRLLRLPALLCAALLCAGCSGHGHWHGLRLRNSAQTTVRSAFLAKRVARLAVSTDSGDVVVKPGSETVIDIAATKIVQGNGRRADLQGLLGRIRPTARLEGDTLLVSSERLEGVLPPGVSGQVSYVITAPKRLALSVASRSGDVRLGGFGGGATVRATSGDVTLRGVAGPIDISSTNGAVTVERTHAEQSVKVSSTNGDVHFTGAASDLDLATTNGGITATLSGDLPLSHAALTSVNGDLELTVPASTSAKVHAQSVNGDLQVAGANTQRMGNHGAPYDDSQNKMGLDLTLGAGAGSISLQTTSGNVRMNTR